MDDNDARAFDDWQAERETECAALLMKCEDCGETRWQRIDDDDCPECGGEMFQP